jgi:hypothetical protein
MIYVPIDAMQAVMMTKNLSLERVVEAIGPIYI